MRVYICDFSTEGRRDFANGERKWLEAVDPGTGGYFRRCVQLQEVSLSERGRGGRGVQTLDTSGFRG